MIDQLKEAAKGVDLGNLALEIEKLIQERLKSLPPEEQMDPMLMIFSFLAARALYRASATIEYPALRAIYLLTTTPIVGEDFKARLVRVADDLKRDLQR